MPWKLWRPVDFFIPFEYFDASLPTKSEYRHFKQLFIRTSRILVSFTLTIFLYSLYSIGIRVAQEGLQVDRLSLFQVAVKISSIVVLWQFKYNKLSLDTYLLGFLFAGGIRFAYLTNQEIVITPKSFFSTRIDTTYFLPLLNLTLSSEFGIPLAVVYIITTVLSFLMQFHCTYQHCRDTHELPVALFSCLIVLIYTYTFDIRNKNQEEILKKLRKAEEAAEKADNAKSAFVSNMSHDMRTPLQSVLGLVELLQHTPLNDSQQHYVFSITAACNNLLSVINNLLQFTRMESSDSHSAFSSTNSKFNIFSLCEQVLESVVMLNTEKHVPIQFDSNITLTDRYIISNHLCLNQILTNLVGNAIKFTENGYVRLSVDEIKMHPNGTRKAIRFKVSDTGRGMSSLFIKEKLFQPFSQESNGSKKFVREGTGLGLWISKKMVDSLDGNLVVSSAPGVGSTFSFVLEVEQLSNLLESDSIATLTKSIQECKNRPHLYVCYEKDISFIAGQIKEWLIQFGFHPQSEEIQPDWDFSQLNVKDPSFVFLLSSHQVLKNVVESPSLPSTSIHIYYVCTLNAVKQLNDMKKAIPMINFNISCVPLPIGPLKLVRSIEKYIENDQILKQKSEPKHEIPTANIVNKNPIQFPPIEALLVDDNPLIVMFLERLTEILGIKATTGNNGLQAVQLFQQHFGKFKVLIIDQQMPVMNGSDAIIQIRQLEEQYSIPEDRKCIIFSMSAVTPTDLPLTERKKLELVNEFLVKPVTMKELTRSLGKYFPKIKS